jgi:hypothetical protein
MVSLTSCYLLDITHQYYKNIADNLSHLSTLALQALLSTSPSGDFEKAQFQHPQEDPTIEKYGNFLTKFVIFLLHNLYQPIENFDVPLHLQHTSNLKTLDSQLQNTISKHSSDVD